MAMAKGSSLRWQCDLSGPQQRLQYLCNTGCLSDIIIKCPGGFSFDLHRVVLAMCSPIFEAMLFGNLATSIKSVCLGDDYKVLKYVFQHCYGYDVQCDDIHVVLNIFKLADKYVINDLKNKCTILIQNLIKPENFKTIYDFTVQYGYNDLRHSCINLLQQDTNNVRATAVLMWFSLNSPRDLLMPVFAVKKLSLDTWRNPKSEAIGDLVSILQGNCCNDLQEFAGQVSGDVIEYIPGPFRSTKAKLTNSDYHYVPVLKFSIQKCNAYEVLMALNERYKKYGPEDIAIHISNDDLPAVCHELSKMHDKFPCITDDDFNSGRFKFPCHACISDNEFDDGIVTLYISDLTDKNLYYLKTLIRNLSPYHDEEGGYHTFIKAYMFPKCKLTEDDVVSFGDYFLFHEHRLLPSCGYMWVYSSNIEIRDEEISGSEDVYHIKVMSSDNDIPGW